MQKYVCGSNLNASSHSAHFPKFTPQKMGTSAKCVSEYLKKVGICLKQLYHIGNSPYSTVFNTQLLLDMFTSFCINVQDILGWGESDRGVSYTFGRDIVQEFNESIGISLICRAHQVVEDGYQFFQRRQVGEHL